MKRKKILTVVLSVSISLIVVLAVFVSIGTVRFYNTWKSTNHVQNMFCAENGLNKDVTNKVYIPERRADEEEFFSWTDTFVIEKYVLTEEEIESAKAIIENNDVWQTFSDGEEEYSNPKKELQRYFDRDAVRVDIDYDTCIYAAYSHKEECFVEFEDTEPYVSLFVYDIESDTYYYTYYDI